MALNTTIADPEADSYATVAEADAYIAARDGFSSTGWNELEDAAKEQRLRFAANMLDAAFSFRGIKATKEQRLSFPRIIPSSKLFRAGQEPFDDIDALTDFAELLDVEVPGIPQDVKDAQIEVAFQVVHSQLLDLDVGEFGGVNVRSMSIGGKISVALGDRGEGANQLMRMASDSTSVINVLLTRYISPRMRLV